MDWAVKLRVASLALVGVLAVGVSSSQAAGPTVQFQNVDTSVAAASGSTLYYAAGATSGQFDVKVTASFTITSVDFPTITGLTGGGTDNTSPFVMTYSWVAPITTTRPPDHAGARR